MSRFSMTARMSLLFMLAFTAVLTVAGLSFYQLCKLHFQSRDQQALVEKLRSTQTILGELSSIEQFAAFIPRLRALLGTHQGLTTVIQDAEQRRIFVASERSEASAQANDPEWFRAAVKPGMWTWHNDQRMYRGMTADMAIAGQPQPLRVMLVLDVTHHMVFFETILRWFWIELAISALVSAGLGWAVARSGLRPLKTVTQVAASISATSLKKRIALAPVPAELQPLVSTFNAMLARLEDDFTRLANFSADIAHELRTPLGNLLTHTEVILSRNRTLEDYQENLHSNLEELQRMSRMIDDMLFLAKSDNGLLAQQNLEIDLESMLEKLLEYYRLLGDERGIDLEFSGSGHMYGDEQMLRRAVSNLLSNALRYTPRGQTIRVTLRHSDAGTRLSVANPGGTIDSEHLERVFDRFYRADPARREGCGHNAGLGLAITRSIVEAHQGRIWCTSSNGWTTFHMEFPALASMA
jgi:two-component system heavy metal sensor histidine kinase CusS